MPLKFSKNFKHDSRHLQNTSLDFGTYPTKKYEGVNQASTGRDREDVRGRGLPEQDRDDNVQICHFHDPLEYEDVEDEV